MAAVEPAFKSGVRWPWVAEQCDGNQAASPVLVATRQLQEDRALVFTEFGMN
jgi:hypothetical protein